MIIPEKEAVVAITADTNEFQREMDAIWDKLYPAFQSEALPENSVEVEKLKQVLAALAAHPAKKS